MTESNTFIGIICALIAALYVGVIYELRRLRNEIEEIRKEIGHSSLAAAIASLAKNTLSGGRK